MTNLLEFVEIRPEVMRGKPVIKGTRITVESILERLAAGETEAQILQENPTLPPEAVRAALFYALQVLRNEDLLTMQLPEK